MDAYIIGNDPGLRKEKREEMDDPAGKKTLIQPHTRSLKLRFFSRDRKTCAHPFQLGDQMMC
jgi:hypothetical protein